MTEIFHGCLDEIRTAPSNGKAMLNCKEYVRSGGTLFNSFICENRALILYFKKLF